MDHSESFVKLVESVMDRVREISPEDVVDMLNSGVDFYFVDVREDHEWNQGRATGAIHIGRGILERDIEKVIPDKSGKVVLYCGGGYRSALAADNIQKMGYKDVLSMAGGIKGWRARGLPEES